MLLATVGDGLRVCFKSPTCVRFCPAWRTEKVKNHLTSDGEITHSLSTFLPLVSGSYTCFYIVWTSVSVFLISLISLADTSADDLVVPMEMPCRKNNVASKIIL